MDGLTYTRVSIGMGAFTSDFRPKIFSRRVEEGPVRESRRIEKKRVE